MPKIEATDVLGTVLDIASTLTNRGPMLNERYLHHLFTHRLQGERDLLGLTVGSPIAVLHPEWPTYKKTTGLAFGRYRKVAKQYLPVNDGTAGFVDFAVGDYEQPYIAIEFGLTHGWQHEGTVFDFLKLLDGENPFRTGVSFNVILRNKGLVRGGYLRNLEEHMDRAYAEAVGRLAQRGEVCDDSRRLYFIITEIDADDNRRHWHLNREYRRFEPGLPSLG